MVNECIALGLVCSNRATSVMDYGPQVLAVEAIVRGDGGW